jgi:subtilase family serine protease
VVIAALGCALASSGFAQSIQTLQNNVRPEVSAGQAPLISAMPLAQQVNFSLVLPLRNQPQLSAFLTRLYDPSSSDFHKFLTVDQFTAQYGPTLEDYQAVLAYAQANGFTVTGTPANRLVVPLSGTVSQIESAFDVRMNVYQHPVENRTFFSLDREPSLNLSVPVAHISGLDSYSIPQAMVIPPPPETALLASGSGSGPGGSYLGSDMRAAYYGGTTLNGNGQAVALLEFDGYNLSDVNATFTNAGQTYNVPVNNVLIDGASGAPTSSGEAEVVLDIVQAIGMAPGLSQVRVYISNGLDDANILNSIASENIAKQISCSWSWRPADPATDDPFFQEFAAQGQSFFAASGDYGAFDATVSPFFYPQEDAYVTAVGGTHLTTTSAGGPWSDEFAWNDFPQNSIGSGGGISPDNIAIPSWQSGVANTSNAGSTTLRNVPDVSMEADQDNYNCSYGSCSSGWAGTSFAAPRWAGFMALVNQQAVEAGNAPLGGIGFLNPSLYILAQGSPYSTDFHDITSGNNDTSNQSLSYNAVAGYDLVTGWGSPTGQHLIDDLAGPQVPGFWIIGSPATVGVLQGASASTTVSVTDAGGFTGNVNLAVTTPLPTGVTATWGTNPTSASSVLTFTADSNAPASTTPLTITGTSGSLSVTTTVTLAVHAPTFLLTPSPSSLGLSPGSTGTSTITVTPQYGFTGAVNLSISGLPTGVTASFSPMSTSGSSTLTVNASSAAVDGTTNLTITGTSGNITVTRILPLTIHEPTFQLSSVASLNLGQGTSGTAPVYIIPSYGFNGSVNLSVSGLPAGVTASFSPNPATASSTLSLTVGASVPVGTTPLTITGTSGNLTITTTISLVVHQPSFTVYSPAAMDMGQGTTYSTYISVAPQYGFTGNVTFSVAGLPAGVTASWSQNPTSSTYTALVLTSTSSTAVGSTKITITGTSGSITSSSTTTLTIHQPTFTVYGPTVLDMGQGSSINAYVSINSQYGFSGNVTFSVTGLPSGVTALWNPNPTTGSTNLTLNSSSTTAVGSSTITITGKSGSITASTTTTLTIHAPSFTVNTYSSLSIGQGSTATSYVSIYPAYGFNGSVNLSVSGLPTGVTASFSPNPTTNSSNLTFTATSTAAIGSKTVTITGTSGALTATATLTLAVFAPTFTVSGPGAADIGQGTTSTFNFYVNPQYGFNSSVNFSVSGLPSGVTASFAPNPTTNSTLMTLVVSGTAPISQSTLTITGTAGSITATTTLTINVHSPSFTISGGYSQNLGQGNSVTSTVWLYPQYGFSGNVNLSVSGLPTGVTASFSPNPVAISGTSYSTSSIMTLTAASTVTPGQYTLTITGTSGSTTTTTPFYLGIFAPAFTLSTGSIYMGQGTTAATNVWAYPQYGFTGNVSLSVSGLPSGVTASFAPNPVSLTSGTYSVQSTLTFTTSSTAAPGQYNVTVTGTSGSQTITTTLYLAIYAPSFYVNCSCYNFSLNQGTSAQGTVTISPQYGFAGSVNLTISGLPNGVTASFSPNPTTSTSTLTMTAGSNATPVNSAPITITGTSGSLTYTTTAYVTVNAQGFSLISAPSQVKLARGSSANATLMVVPYNGFTGDVSFSASGLPAGVTAAFSPNPTTGSSSMTFAADSSAASGTVPVVVTGTSGSITATSSLILEVDATAPATTATTLKVSAAGSAANSVVAGTVVTLTASVKAGSTTVKSGQINFCNAVTNGCDATHLIDTAQLTSAGTATLKFIPGMGVHSYKAVFSGTATNAGSTSSASALTVTSSQPTTTALAVAGSAGNYTLTATVTGAGSVAPTGAVSFIDATNNNSVLATADLANSKMAITWGNPQAPATGQYPLAIATADFNQDGIPDLAIANNSAATVTILLGKGDGTFTAAASALSVGSYPTAIVAGDFNGDGIADLAVANSNSNYISIFVGKGDGSFTPSSDNPPTGSQPVALVLGDLNGDGIPDLAALNASSGTVTVELGNGDGTFTPSPLSAQAGSYPRAMSAADFNNDGILDLAVVGGYNSTLAILLGNGDGSFTAAIPPTLPQNSNPNGVIAADFNQDGNPDLAVIDSYTNVIYIFLGHGDGTFAAAASNATGLNSASKCSAADLNGDGKPDLVEVNGSQMGILLGNGDGTFAAVTTVSAGNYPSAIAAGDFNGDGTQDLAITNTYNNTAVILTSQLSQTITAIATGVSPVGTGTHNVQASYPGDTSYKSSVSTTVALTAQLATPTVTVTPSSANITTGQPLTVTIMVAGNSGNPIPTGSVVLASGSFTSAATTLAGGVATINVPAGSLATGTDTLTVTFTPDAAGASTWNVATGSSSVTVLTAIGTTAATVTVQPAASTITSLQNVTVTVTVAGPTGQPAPTGAVTLSSGSYSAQQVLAGGSASFTIAAGALASGADTLTAAYSGDATYATASGSATVTVAPVLIAVPTLSSVLPGSTATGNVIFTAGSYSGTMSLSCTLTASPSGAQSLPGCSLNPTSVTLASGGTATAAVTITTTAASTASLVLPAQLQIWKFGGAGSLLAAVLMFGIPARRRRWASMLALLLFVAIAGAIGCGGGSGNSTQPPSTHTTPATAAGNYTFTVKATDSAANVTTSANITLTVQ